MEPRLPIRPHGKPSVMVNQVALALACGKTVMLCYVRGNIIAKPHADRTEVEFVPNSGMR
jgi:hypothetical protein